MHVLVTGARAPIAADIAKALAFAGHKVWVADSLRFPLGAGSPFVAGRVRLPPPRTQFPAFRAALIRVCEGLSIDAIIPTSEEVFWLAGAATHLPARVNVRTSAATLLAQLHHKGSFAKLATRLGFGARENHELHAPADVATLAKPQRFAFKPIYSRFATHTVLGPANSRALARIRPTPENPWLAQTLLHGREYCLYNIAESGRLLLHVAYAPMFRYGVGASLYFAPVVDARLRALSERFVAATGFTGQISFDVMDTPAGLVALECNPRGTSGVHLAAQRPEIFAAALLGQSAEPADTFAPAARMLRAPILLQHPGALWRASERRLIRSTRDALAAAGVPWRHQLAALVEMTWLACRRRTSLQAVSTADIEWNGEPFG